MDKIIEALYHGSISPQDKRPTAKELALMDTLEGHMAIIQKGLDPAAAAALEGLQECCTDLADERELEVFKMGFKLGMCLALEGTDLQAK